MVLQGTISVMNLCVKYFKTGSYTHRYVSTYIAYKCCVLCWQAWSNMHVVMPLLLCKVANFAVFCRIFSLCFIFITCTDHFHGKMLSFKPAMFQFWVCSLPLWSTCNIWQ